MLKVLNYSKAVVLFAVKLICVGSVLSSLYAKIFKEGQIVSYLEATFCSVTQFILERFYSGCIADAPAQSYGSISILNFGFCLTNKELQVERELFSMCF